MLFWLIVINPATKYALMLNPLSSFIESKVIRDHSRSHHHHHSCNNNLSRYALRAGVCGLTVTIVIVFPEFEKMLAIVGALCSYSVCVVFPTACYLKIFYYTPKNEQMIHNSNENENENECLFHDNVVVGKPKFSKTKSWIILSISIFMAMTGTFWPFIFPSL